MAYQAKLIEEYSWRIFAEPFYCIHIHIKMWWSIDSDGGLNKFIWWLIKPNSLKKVRNASLQNISIVSTFILRLGDQSTLMENRMSLSDGLSSQLIEEDSWRIFAETFHYFNIHIKVWQANEDQRELHKKG